MAKKRKQKRFKVTCPEPGRGRSIRRDKPVGLHFKRYVPRVAGVTSSYEEATSSGATAKRSRTRCQGAIRFTTAATCPDSSGEAGWVTACVP